MAESSFTALFSVIIFLRNTGKEKLQQEKKEKNNRNNLGKIFRIF
jgi:hypothetical protein